MGAFLLIHNKKLQQESFNNRLIKTLDFFSEKQGLPFEVKFDLGEFTLYLYKKRFYQQKNYLSFDDNGFIATTGSLFYKGTSGSEALKKLYQDFINGIKIEYYLKGHYFVVIRHQEGLFVFRDYYGIYPVYHNKSKKNFSSSFLAVASLENSLSIAKDELYEYYFNGYWYGTQTLFNEIELLKPKQCIEINQGKLKEFKVDTPPLNKRNYNQILDIVSSNLCNHFAELTNAYNNISTGLSGGYDSRLMLAGLLNQRFIPYLYVNGIPNSMDIRCAREIANTLNLNLKEVYFYKEYENIKNDATNFIDSRFYFFDGLGGGGLFDHYSDIEYSLKYAQNNHALFNGAGGEIYREAWNITQNKISLNAFVKARYDKYPFSSILKDYTRKEYLKHMFNKRHINLGLNKNLITRFELEHLHVSRYKAIHFIMSTKQKLNPFIMPFYEPSLLEQSLHIPIKYKSNARFNKDLISKLYPALNSFMSAYGYTFDQKIPKKIALKEYMITKTPLQLRPVLRKFKKSRKLPIKKYSTNLLDSKYIQEVLPQGTPKINEYIIVENLQDDTLKSRALSLEYLFNHLRI